MVNDSIPCMPKLIIPYVPRVCEVGLSSEGTGDGPGGGVDTVEAVGCCSPVHQYNIYNDIKLCNKQWSTHRV